MNTLTIDASLKNNVDRAFTLMNAFASGDTQSQHARVEPLAVLGEVYMLLAPVSQAMQAAVEPAAQEPPVIMARRPRVDLMPYPQGMTWDQIDCLEGAMPVLHLRDNLYLGVSGNTLSQANLVMEFEGADYDFDMGRVVQAAEGDYELQRFCEDIRSYTATLDVDALASIARCVRLHKDVLEKLSELLLEEAHV